MVRRHILLGVACVGLLPCSAIADVPVNPEKVRYDNYAFCAAFALVVGDNANTDGDDKNAKNEWTFAKEMENRAKPLLEGLGFTEFELQEDIQINRIDLEDKFNTLGEADSSLVEADFGDHCDGVYVGNEELDKELTW